MAYISNNKKGQTWSFDFTVAVTVLIFILMFYLIMWNSIIVRWSQASQRTAMESTAYFASESLLATPGEPKSWEMADINDASAIGLVNGRNELSRTKLNKLISNTTNYTFVKKRLGLHRYEFGMRITDISGNTVYYEFGNFSTSINNSLDFKRFAILDGDPVILQMEVWGK